MAFGKTYSPTTLPGRKHRGVEDEEEADRLIAQMEADARNAGGIGTGIGTAIGGGLGALGGTLLATGTSGLGAAALAPMITGGMGVGGAIGGAIGNMVGSSQEAKADEIRQRRERQLAEQQQRLMALAPLAASLGQRRYS